MNKSFIFKFVNVLLYFTCVIGFIMIVTFDYVFNMDNSKYTSFDFEKYKYFFYILGLLMIYINIQLIKIFKTIKVDMPFIDSNVIALKKIAVSLVLIGIIFMISLSIEISYLRIIAVICFICSGLCAYVFSQLFKSAIYIKEENDYTI